MSETQQQQQRMHQSAATISSRGEVTDRPSPNDGEEHSAYSEYEIPIHEDIPGTRRIRSGFATSAAPAPVAQSASSSRSHRSQFSQRSNRNTANASGDRGAATATSININDRDSTVATNVSDINNHPLWETSLHHTPPPTIQERIANTAISGTIELLKQVGGVTVSATGALVAPPLHITRTILLPNLYAAFKDFISSHSPVRIKDWFRIVSTSIYHIFNTLQNTDTGHAFSNRLVLVFIDVIDCISAETTRQLLLDTMSCFVKFFDILDTPIFQSYCEQLTVTGCRLIDAISNGRNKLLLHDLQKVVISAGELLADPATTIALAEVTAYLCYALEMEDQQIQIDERRQQQQKEKKDPSAKSSSISHSNNNNNTKVKNSSTPRRKERDDCQTKVILQRNTLNGGHAVEEVLLSCLNVNNTGNDRDPSISNTIPTSIVLDKQDQQQSFNNNGNKDNITLTPNLYKSPKFHDTTLEWHERARDDVNVQVLREGILQRAILMEQQQQQEETDEEEQIHVPSNEQSAPLVSNEGKKTTSTTPALETLLDIEEDRMAPEMINNKRDHDNIQEKRKKNPIQVHFAKDDDGDEIEIDSNEKSPKDDDPIDPMISNFTSSSKQDTSRKDGETANDHFFRILDEILSVKRNEAVESITSAEQQQGTSSVHKSGMSRNRRQQQQQQQPSSNPTIRDRLNEIRANNLNKKSSNHSDKKSSTISVDKNSKKTIVIVAIIVALMVCFWFIMGCYGLYIFFKKPPLSSTTSIPIELQPKTSIPHMSSLSSPVSSSSTQEIVIRIVKEVVHINQDGKEIGRGPWKPQQQQKDNNNDDDDGNNNSTNEDYQKIAECVASIYSNPS